MSSVRFRLSVPGATSNKGCGISTIVLTGNESANDGSLIFSTTVNGTSYTFTGLTPGSTYYARVKGDSDWSYVLTFTTKNTSLELANNEDNSSAIATAATNGGKYDVTLSNRTLWKDGDWNTLCLPFNATLSGDLADATIMELDTEDTYDTDKKTGFDANDGTLYLYFKTAESIVAGTPYIIKWEGGDPIVNPTFTGVTINSTAATTVKAKNNGLNAVQFIGTYSPVAYDDGTAHKDVLFLGSGSNLYYPDGQSATSINAFRAYFHVDFGENANATIKRTILNFGDGDATEIETVNHEPLTINQVYDLSGRRIDGVPTAKGVYIVNGSKVVIK